VRASSHSTNASNRSDLPPETRNRSRAAATLFGCNANTRSPASSSRSTSSPSGRSIATSPTSSRTSVRHNAVSPFSSCAKVTATTSAPVSSATSTSCFSDAQSIPAYRQPILHLFRSLAFTAPRPRGTVADAHRQGPHSSGLRPVAACGTSPPSGRAGLWQALHTTGKQSWPSPGGGRGNQRMSYEQSRTRRSCRRPKRSCAADDLAEVSGDTVVALRLCGCDPVSRGPCDWSDRGESASGLGRGRNRRSCLGKPGPRWINSSGAGRLAGCAGGFSQCLRRRGRRLDLVQVEDSTPGSSRNYAV
jgi:hypothetical protein